MQFLCFTKVIRARRILREWTCSLCRRLKDRKDGSMEIKFFDRLKALEKLGAGGEHETGAKQLFDAIPNNARAVNDKENGN